MRSRGQVESGAQVVSEHIAPQSAARPRDSAPLPPRLPGRDGVDRPFQAPPDRFAKEADGPLRDGQRLLTIERRLVVEHLNADKRVGLREVLADIKTDDTFQRAA